MLMPQRPCRAEAWQKLLLARAEGRRKRAGDFVSCDVGERFLAILVCL